MTRYRVTATLRYTVDLPDTDAVFEHADTLDDLGDVERAEVYVDSIKEDTWPI